MQNQRQRGKKTSMKGDMLLSILLPRSSNGRHNCAAQQWIHPETHRHSINIQIVALILPITTSGTCVSVSASTANMLDAMLLRNGGKGGSERRPQDSGGGTVTVSAPRMLWCHCYHHCPEDSVNNTCM